MFDTPQVGVETADVTQPFTSASPRTRPSLRPCVGGTAVRALWALALTTLTVACGTPDAATPPPPLAGLQHPEVVRVGQAVTFDASSTAAGTLRDSKGAVVDVVDIVRYRFVVADGSAARESALPTWSHTFDGPGIFALSVTVEDEQGRESTVTSSVHVAADYTPTCTEQDPGGCDSGRCSGDVCSRIACADQPVCPGDTTCSGGFCLVDPPRRAPADAFTGADGGATGIDADDRRVP